MNPAIFAYKAIRALISPSRRFIALAHRGFYDSMPDEKYIKRMYKCSIGRELDLQNPKTFTEKLNWLKLYDHRPEYTLMADKYESKKIIAEIVGSRYVIPTLVVWESFDEIDFDSLPEQFVLKCTHDSGSVIIVQDKSRLNIKKACRILQKGLGRNYYSEFREWPYKDIKPRIMAEQYLSDIQAEYKIFCFDGEPGLILVCKGKAHGEGRTNDYYDMSFKHIPVRAEYPNAPTPDEKPVELDEMLEVARKLSAGIPQVRIDFYLAGGKVYTGEITFYHEAGNTKFKPEIYDEKFGELITLPEKRS